MRAAVPRQVAEGVATSRNIVKLLEKKVRGYRRDLKYPILYGVAAILDGKLTPRQARSTRLLTT